MKRVLPFMFYLVFYAAAVFLFPFTILYFQEAGFTSTQIGVLAGIMPLISLIGAPLLTGLADATNRHKLIMSLSIAVIIITTGVFPFLKSFFAAIPVIVLYSLFLSPVGSFADSATLTMLGAEKELYGRIRMGGTFGWGIVAPLAGLVIAAYGTRWAFWGFAIIMVLNLFICQKFAFIQKPRQESMTGDIRRVLADKRWALFLALAFIGGVALTVINSFLFPYMNELGINKASMEIALTIATVSELPILFFANHLLKRFKAHGLLVLAVLVTGLRLLLYAGFNFQSGILVFQLLNGMTFPMFWVAGVAYANEISPQGMKATGQGLLGAMVIGIGSAAGGLGSGLLMGAIGGQGLFLYAGLFVLASLAVILLAERALRAPRPGSLG